MIEGHVLIRDCTIWLNGREMFRDREAHPGAFADHAYGNLGVQYPKFYKMDLQSKLGFLAAEALLKDNSSINESTALILSNSNASLDTDLRYTESAATIASPALFVYTLANIVAGEICIRHKIKGENAFFVTPSFDPRLMEVYTDAVIASGTRMCIAGWVNVLGPHHDVFLYLRNVNAKSGIDHNASNLEKLYKQLWNN